MRAPAAAVVAGWGALNGALVTVLAVFGAAGTVVAIYGASAGLVEAAAIAFWAGQRRQDRRGGQRAGREPPNGDSVLLTALGVLIAGLGWIFAWPLALVALLPFAAALLHEVSLRRGGLTATREHHGGVR